MLVRTQRMISEKRISIFAWSTDYILQSILCPCQTAFHSEHLYLQKLVQMINCGNFRKTQSSFICFASVSLTFLQD